MNKKLFGGVKTYLFDATVPQIETVKKLAEQNGIGLHENLTTRRSHSMRTLVTLEYGKAVGLTITTENQAGFSPDQYQSKSFEEWVIEITVGSTREFIEEAVSYKGRDGMLHTYAVKMYPDKIIIGCTTFAASDFDMFADKWNKRDFSNKVPFGGDKVYCEPTADEWDALVEIINQFGFECNGYVNKKVDVRKTDSFPYFYYFPTRNLYSKLHRNGISEGVGIKRLSFAEFVVGMLFKKRDSLAVDIPYYDGTGGQEWYHGVMKFDKLEVGNRVFDGRDVDELIRKWNERKFD
jgi:hypothetical protein